MRNDHEINRHYHSTSRLLRRRYPIRRRARPGQPFITEQNRFSWQSYSVRRVWRQTRRDDSFDAVAGTRTDTLLGTVTNVTVDTDGTFVGNDDTGCNITGAITIPDARYNLYNASASVSGCGQLDGTPGADRNGSYTGLGTLEPSGNSGARLIIAVDNGVVPGIFLLN